MTASNRFEDRLLDQLRQVVAERPAPEPVTHRRRHRTRLALAGAGVAAATAAVALVVSSNEVTPNAYAVQSRPDGSISVSIRSLSDADGLQRSLRDAGVPAVVDYVPSGERDCPAPSAASPGEGSSGGNPDGPTFRRDTERGSGPSLSQAGPENGRADDSKGVRKTKTMVTAGSDGVKFTIDPGTIHPGEKVYITTSTGSVSSIGMTIGKERPPACATNAPTP
jgi:hypothetical protein